MSDIGPGLARQGEIYMSGLQGKRATLPFSLKGLEAAAEAKMSPEAFAYVAGGAGAETTMANNRSAFERYRIVPRMARDCSSRIGAEIEIQKIGLHQTRFR